LHNKPKAAVHLGHKRTGPKEDEENGHSIGPMEEIMETVHITNKGPMMDTLEKFYIFCETKLNNQINDKLAIKPNIIFDTIVQKDPHRGIPNVNSTQ
jgi:hypothetical protein